MTVVCRLDIAGAGTWELVVMQQAPSKGDFLRGAIDEHPVLIVSRVDWELAKPARGFDCTLRCHPHEPDNTRERMTLVEMKNRGLI